jgi:hypothetical protein
MNEGAFLCTTAYSGDVGAWRTDFKAFKEMVGGNKYKAGSFELESIKSWVGTYQGIEQDLKSKDGALYDIAIDLGPIDTVGGKVELKFSCNRQDAEKWKLLKPGTIARFSAKWINGVLVFPGTPKYTMFSDVQLIEALSAAKK